MFILLVLNVSRLLMRISATLFLVFILDFWDYLFWKSCNIDLIGCYVDFIGTGSIYVKVEEYLILILTWTNTGSWPMFTVLKRFSL